MDSQPQNPEFRLILKTFTHVLRVCLCISSLPGKALRMLVDIARLAERFNMHSQSRAL